MDAETKLELWNVDVMSRKAKANDRLTAGSHL